MTRRTKKDLEYLLKTTKENGETNNNTALFAERDLRLKEHEWREEKFGENTEEGKSIAIGLMEMIENKGSLDKVVDKYGSVPKIVQEAKN